MDAVEIKRDLTGYWLRAHTVSLSEALKVADLLLGVPTVSFIAPPSAPDLPPNIAALEERLEAQENPTADLSAGKADLAPGQEKAP